MLYFLNVLGLARIFFLLNIWYDAMFWIYDENGGDNTPMFSAVAEQHSHRTKDFSASGADLSARTLGVHKVLGGNTGRTSGPRDVPCHVASWSAIKLGGVGLKGFHCSKTGWASVG